jgi:hypothetical protein
MMECTIGGGFAFAAGKFLFGVACVGGIILLTFVGIFIHLLFFEGKKK